MSKEETKKENEIFYLSPVIIIREVGENRLVNRHSALFKVELGYFVTRDNLGTTILTRQEELVKIDTDLTYKNKKEAEDAMKYYNDVNNIALVDRFVSLEKRFKELLNNLKQA